MTSFTFTIKQLKEIFDAGCTHGENEATAFDWGTHCSSSRDDEFAWAMADLINNGKDWDAEDRVEENDIKEMMKNT